MSRPPFLTLPGCARAHRLRTARGEFAVHDARPEGTARGTVLLVPGFTGSKEDFIALLEPLARAGFRVVAVDGRGQHETEGPRDEAAYAQQELARDVLAQAAALDADAESSAPLHVLGHSLGGLIVRAAVMMAPDAFASLTLMSSGPAAISESQQARTKLLVDALTVTDMENVWHAMRELDPPEAPEENTPPGVEDFLHQRWLGTVPEQLIVTGRQLNREPDRVAELAGVALPKHVLSGVVDYAWPVPLMDEMAERLAARRTVIQGAGHSPNAERPLPTAEALIDFWRGVSPS
ncbi:alpha/beta hydrolase [Streptomyces sp. ME19-01-6]|uniref:alpha/beta fold hydrolase n=1 Tax=Streptomyces sp. ME19-01-6 TaxID=3028686 RepID=UPI0029B0E5C0|nr:alpha/beta hydrolase [Streptomyces sp. ME19-01-6]MDX3225750.1 alpha/beta hydrolase [Streptomyces sp. ME19-01-6]